MKTSDMTFLILLYMVSAGFWTLVFRIYKAVCPIEALEKATSITVAEIALNLASGFVITVIVFKLRDKDIR